VGSIDVLETVEGVQEWLDGALVYDFDIAVGLPGFYEFGQLLIGAPLLGFEPRLEGEDAVCLVPEGHLAPQFVLDEVGGQHLTF
jgi:hypothetical protein